MLLMSEVAYGFRKKEAIAVQKKDEDDYEKYIVEPHLIKALNMLGIFAYQYHLLDHEGRPLVPINETDAILNYFSNDLAEWMGNWPKEAQDQIQSLFGDFGPLIKTRDHGTKFFCTEDCNELADQCPTFNQDAEQRQLYMVLKLLSQEAYAFTRAFIIRHPIINATDRRKLSNGLRSRGVNEKSVKRILDNAYEAIPYDAAFRCPYCGWTASQKPDEQLQCIHPRCSGHFNEYTPTSVLNPSMLNRLKPGVMRYIALPGKLELKIAEICEERHLSYEMWPHLDAYDIRIHLNHKVFAVDAKDYQNAFVLRYEVMKHPPFTHSDWQHAFLVVPDAAVNERTDYCDVVNRAWQSSGHKKCVSFSDFIRKLKDGVPV